MDCSTGDSSCLCQECFEAGNHEVRCIFVDLHSRVINLNDMLVVVVVVVTVVILNPGKKKVGVKSIEMQNMFQMQINVWLKSTISISIFTY